MWLFCPTQILPHFLPQLLSTFLISQQIFQCILLAYCRIDLCKSQLEILIKDIKLNCAKYLWAKLCIRGCQTSFCKICLYLSYFSQDFCKLWQHNVELNCLWDVNTFVFNQKSFVILFMASFSGEWSQKEERFIDDYAHRTCIGKSSLKLLKMHHFWCSFFLNAVQDTAQTDGGIDFINFYL